MTQNTLLASNSSLTLHSVNDALDVLSSGLEACIFTVDDLAPDFFNLRSGIAGECFQKFVNYRFRVAFVIPTNHGYGERITELVRDHQRHPYIQFFNTIDDANEWLS